MMILIKKTLNRNNLKIYLLNKNLPKIIKFNNKNSLWKYNNHQKLNKKLK